MARSTGEAEGADGPDGAGPVAGVRQGLAAAGVRFDAAVALLTSLSVVGFLFDVRSHMEGLDFAEEGFLTPEHTVVYGGVAAAAALVAAAVVVRRDAATTWRAAVPDGYGAGVVGVGVFALGGPGDFLWHTAFGAEANVEALVSPTHLLLATGGVLVGTSPLRAAWRRDGGTGWPTQVAVVVPAALTLTIVTGFLLYSHPAVLVPGSDTGFVRLPLTGLQLHAALLVGVVLALVDRFRLWPGGLTVVVGFNGAAMTMLGRTTFLLPAYLLTGVAADLSYAALRPDAMRSRSVRAFAAALPAVLAALHFGTLAVRGALAWTVHLWVGSVFLTGAAGLLVSYLVVPPRGPGD